jgi:hypothetical protein
MVNKSAVSKQADAKKPQPSRYPLANARSAAGFLQINQSASLNQRPKQMLALAPTVRRAAAEPEAL